LKEMENKSTLQITAGEKGIKQDRPRRRGLRRRGRGTYEGDKPPVQTFERRGKTSQKEPKDDTKKMLKKRG